MIAWPARVGGWDTRMLAAGREGPLALFVHGLGSRADCFAGNLDALAAAGYRAVALDLPGHGFAAKGSGFDYGVPGYAAFLARALDDLAGGEPAVLVGASFGGNACARLACDEPERVAALVLVGSLGLHRLGEARRARSVRALRALDREALRERLLGAVADPALVTDDLVEEEVRINTSPGAREAFAALAEYMGERVNDDVVLDRLAAAAPRPPLALLWGEADRSVPLEVAEEAARACRGSLLAVFGGAGHMPYRERADAFDAVLADFLRGEPGAYDGVEIRRAGD